MSLSTANISVEMASDGVALATLNRPDRLNALTLPMFDELHNLQRWVEREDSVRVLVITGAGRGFCAGLDLDDAASLLRMSTREMWVGQRSWAQAVSGFRELSKPVIAAVNGAAAGAGFGLALAADIRVASSSARFNAAFVRIGLTGGDVGTSWMLPRLVGLGRATEILLTGRFVDAAEALDIGIVTSVASPDTVVAGAVEIAEQICANSPLGVQLTKTVLQQNVDAPSLAAAIALENSNQTLCTRTQDMAEALEAFREKRPPQFAGT